MVHESEQFRLYRPNQPGMVIRRLGHHFDWKTSPPGSQLQQVADQFNKETKQDGTLQQGGFSVQLPMYGSARQLARR